jgi:signal transduction histidine kinase
MSGAAPRGPRLPLFVNLLALVLVSLVAAELVSLAIVMTLPRPEPDFYALADVEQALNGLVVQAPPVQGGAPRPFKIDRRASPPNASSGQVRNGMERRIARDLGTDPGNVVFARPYPGPLSMRLPPSMNHPQGDHWPPGGRRPDFRGDGPPPPGRSEGQAFVVAPFIAALKLADGSWRVVESRRRGLLDPWEQHVLLWFLVSAAALTPMAYLFARRLAAPIAAFASAAERLGRDPNAPPLELEGSAEVAVAAQAFNDMQSRLRRYVHDRTSMIGAVAHDLRTPLTRLRFHIEEAPEPVRAKMAADIGQMDAMVADVLAFVRDASQTTAHVKLELSSLLETLAEEFTEIGADVSIQHAERTVVEGDSLALKRLFSNLIDNAVKFGGLARVQLRSDDGMAVVDVEDDGPGLPAGDLESVFEPFHRVEPSRSRDTGGIGLGLTVARTIARAHGGDVVLENRIGGGLLARVRLPT